MGVPDGRWKFGVLEHGTGNLITDVPGVRVGHVTIAEEGHQTGVTAVLPHGENLFRSKVPAAVHVINGFGKSAGLMQIREMGTIETPIILTNTFAVGTCVNAVVTHMLEQNPEIGDTTGTVNPLVMECNDGVVNAIRDRAVTEAHVHQAIADAGQAFAEGAVGGGRGMCCYDLKGGIGSASRIIRIGEETFTVGALLMTNFGTAADLTICGDPIGKRIAAQPEKEQGSVIIILATDLPMSCRQMGRAARRAQNGLARTGTFTACGSGEVVVMFSTANQIRHWPQEKIASYRCVSDDELDQVFRAVTECVEESVISSIYHAESMTSRKGKPVHSLKEYL